MAGSTPASAQSAPFLRIGPAETASPVVLSVPHAGRDYSEALLKSSRLPHATLETLEDRFVDRLIWRALSTGATAIVAQAPRAEIDLNRDEREIEPSAVRPSPPAHGLLRSPRSRGGLGLIPTRISGSGQIWSNPLQGSELSRRIAEIHRPYHAAIKEALDAARARYGIAILLDCHSMPPRPGEAGVVLGDRHGTSISPDLLDAAVAAARTAGFRVALNLPYAGGHVTARHGQPITGVHALQVEIDRSLYLASDLRSPGSGFDRVARLLATIVEALAARAIDPPQSIAAE